MVDPSEARSSAAHTVEAHAARTTIQPQPLQHRGRRSTANNVINECSGRRSTANNVINECKAYFNSHEWFSSDEIFSG